MSKYIRPIIFTIIITLLIAILPYLKIYQLQYFLFFCLIIALVITLLFYISRLGHKRHINFQELIHFDKNYYYFQLAKHYLYPIVLFISQVLFLLTNYDKPFELIILIATSICYFFLFLNIQSYFENKFLMEKKTHAVYDFIKVIIYFLLTHFILHFYFTYQVDQLVIISLIAILSAVAFYFSIFRLRVKDVKLKLVSILVAIVIWISVYILINVFSFNLIRTNIMTFSIFYLILSLLRHRLDGNLSKNIIFEYLSFEALVWVLIYFMK